MIIQGLRHKLQGDRIDTYKLSFKCQNILFSQLELQNVFDRFLGHSVAGEERTAGGGVPGDKPLP